MEIYIVYIVQLSPIQRFFENSDSLMFVNNDQLNKSWAIAEFLNSSTLELLLTASNYILFML